MRTVLGGPEWTNLDEGSNGLHLLFDHIGQDAVWQVQLEELALRRHSFPHLNSAAKYSIFGTHVSQFCSIIWIYIKRLNKLHWGQNIYLQILNIFAVTCKYNNFQYLRTIYICKMEHVRKSAIWHIVFVLRRTVTLTMCSCARLSIILCSSAYLWTSLCLRDHLWIILCPSAHLWISLCPSTHLWTSLCSSAHLWIILCLNAPLFTILFFFVLFAVKC